MGDTKIIFLAEDTYDIEIVGNGEGKMSFDIQEYNIQDELVKTITFDNIKVTPNTRIFISKDDEEITLKNVNDVKIIPNTKIHTTKFTSE